MYTLALTLSMPPIYKQNVHINIQRLVLNPPYKVQLAYRVNGHILCVRDWLSLMRVQEAANTDGHLIQLLMPVKLMRAWAAAITGV